MRTHRINTVSAKLLTLLSVTALITVLTGYFQPAQTDEGAAAHIFQLSIVALVPVIVLFVATADWRQPWSSVRRIAFPAATLVLAFVSLFYLENYR